MRKVIKTIAAAAVALTSISAVPAAAGDKNLERFVIGAGTILLLNELNKHGKVEAHHTKRYGKKYDNGHRRHSDKRHYGKRHHGKKHYGKNRRAHLPRRCLVTVRQHHRWVQVYSARCLRRYGY